MAESDAGSGETAAVGARRPIAARNTGWAAAAASWLVRKGVTPNAISLASVGFGAWAGAALLGTRFVHAAWLKAIFFVLAILGIQCRLLCNLFDGMVAVEGGKAGKAGEVFNDFPDRVADPLIFIAAGFAAGRFGVSLGWAAALLAVMTAYVRVLGRSLGAATYFIGPMAKQHRMGLMTAACAIGAVMVFGRGYRPMLSVTLAVICVGCVVTLVRRTLRIVADLESRGEPR